MFYLCSTKTPVIWSVDECHMFKANTEVRGDHCFLDNACRISYMFVNLMSCSIWQLIAWLASLAYSYVTISVAFLSWRSSSVHVHFSTSVWGLGGTLIESTSFVRRVMGSTPALTATYRDLGQVLHSQLPVALQRENLTQYPCCVESPSE